MNIYLSLCLLPCLVLSAPVENVTVGTITLPKNVTPAGLPTEPKPKGEQEVTKGLTPLPTITHPPLHTVEQERDPHVESVEGDIERRRLLANRRRIERLRAIHSLRQADSSRDPDLHDWLNELAGSSGREEEIQRYLQLRDRYEPLVRFLSARRLGSKRGSRFRSWLDQMISKFGRDWDIQGYVDHGVWWEPLASLIFGTETMENRELEDDKDWYYPRSQKLVTDPPMDWETGKTRGQTGEPGGESQWEKDLIEQELRDMEAEERLYRGSGK